MDGDRQLAYWRLRAALEDDHGARMDLARYVLEYLPIIGKMVDNAGALLKARTGNGSFEAYAALATRLALEVRAVYDSLRDLDPAFDLEPPVWIDEIQAIRLAPLLIEERKGNCLEFALLFAACLLRARIYPLIVVLESEGRRHAVAAVWLTEDTTPMGDAAVLSGAQTRELWETRRILAVDCSVLTEGPEGSDYASAVRTAEGWMSDGRPLFAVDLWAARMMMGILAAGNPRAILPALPSRACAYVRRPADMSRLVNARFDPATRIVNIHGLPGVGKRTLVVEAVRLWAQMAPFGDFLFFDAGDPRRLTLKRFLEKALEDLSPPAGHESSLGISDRLAISLQDKARKVKQILAAGPVLIAVANFDRVQDQRLIEFIKDTPEPSAALLSSHQRLGWGNCRYAPLRLMSRPQSLALIRNEADRYGGLRLPEKEIEALASAVDGWPTAAAVGVNRLATSEPIAVVVERLHQIDRNLDELYKYVREPWTGLPAAAVRVLGAAALFPAPVSYEALERMSGLPKQDFEDARGKVVEMAFLVPSDDGHGNKRFTVQPPPIRALSLDKLQSQPAILEDVELRAQAHYIASFPVWSRKLPGFHRILEDEIENILEVLSRLNHFQRFAHLLNLLDPCVDLLWDSGRYRELSLAWAEKGHGAARAVKDCARAIRYACRLARWHFEAGRSDLALTWAGHAETDARIGERPDDPRLLQVWGLRAVQEGNLDAAEEYLHGARAGYRTELARAPAAARDEPEFQWTIAAADIGDVWCERGNQSRRMGNLETAGGWYGKAIGGYDEPRELAAVRCEYTVDDGPRHGDRWAGFLARCFSRLGEMWRLQAAVARDLEPDAGFWRQHAEKAAQYYGQGYQVASRIHQLATAKDCEASREAVNESLRVAGILPVSR
jgi:hypothetical protein